jgi:hypothetical protein
MRITVQFGPWNPKRYGKPWIAKVTAWPVGKAPTLEFGALVGTTPEIAAEPGTVVRWGQRDYRGNGTERHWGVVLDDGTIEPRSNEECRAHWLATMAEAVT